MAMRDALLPEFDQEMANTRKMLERVPENRFDFQPHPKSFKLNRLAGHVADLPSWAMHNRETQLLELEVAKFVPCLLSHPALMSCWRGSTSMSEKPAWRSPRPVTRT